jgi:hypothetical protein
MDISIIIPTRPTDDGTVDRCVAAVRPQLGPRDEILVSIDGPISTGSFGAMRDASDVRVVTGPRTGPGGARNRALDAARNPLILFLNDDVIAEDGLLEAHRTAHADQGLPDARPPIVLGSAPWHRFPNDRVIDRMVRETSLIFFYDRMDTTDPDRDWGYRHAWTLNLSLPAMAALRFDQRLSQPMFDDLEWACRVQQTFGSPVLYRPDAAVTHRHRYEPLMLLRREALLGHQAHVLGQVNPVCAADVFGRRYAPDPSNIQQHESHITSSIGEAGQRFADLCTLGDRPANEADEAMIRSLFETCRIWRDAARSVGFLAAARGEDADTAQSSDPHRGIVQARSGGCPPR